MALPATFPMRVADGETVDVPAVGFGTWTPGMLYSMSQPLQNSHVGKVN